MPFLDGVYYPYTSDTQGTHSSAGIPSLLNSPLSQQTANGHSAPGMTPSSSASTVPPFKFRPRRESVDWRRISAVDIDLVISQLDVDALQDYISTVTFCNLEGERCQRCQSPVDPALVKLLRLAQLTVEWLLHCQEFLSLSLRAAEERLAAAGGEREQLLAQQKKQEEKVKALTAELKQRKKVIRTQQSLFAPRIISSHKSHMQRRHPDEYENELRSDSEKKSQIENLKSEISSLKEQISQQQQHALQTKTAQEKEQLSLHKDWQRELDHFKAEAMARVDRKIEDSQDGIRREMQIYARNIQANEANLNLTAKREKPASPVQPERDVDNYKEVQMQAIQKLEQQLRKQDKKWEVKMKEMKAQHESEKNQWQNELSRMQSSVSEQQEQSQRLQQEMSRRLQEKDQAIKAQREQIKSISSNPPTKIVEVPVMVAAPAPEPKPKRVILEEPISALKLDPIQELSEEEKDSSSYSERKTVERKPDPVPAKKPKMASSALKRNNSMKKDMRRGIEEALIHRMEKLGVKPDQTGLKNQDLNSILAKVQTDRDKFAKANPDFWRVRDELMSIAEQRLDSQRRGSDPAPVSQTRSRQSVQAVQIRPRSSSLPSRVTKVQSGPAVKQPKTPQPAPRTKTTTQPQTSTPNTKTVARIVQSKTPPFSSDEETEDEDTDMEEEQPQKLQSRKSPQPRLNQVQIRAGKSGPNQAPFRHSISSNQQQSRGSAAVGTKTAVTKEDSDEEEDDDDWSDVSDLQEIDLRQQQSHKDQNGNVEQKSSGKENKISDLARKMEKQLAERGSKKPTGGVSILPESKEDVQELTITDLEESSEWLVSSLEERLELSKPAQSSTRKSLESSSTSVWGTSTGKAPKSGLTEAGTGSTLKSSLCSLSDISDSEEISNNKHNKRYG
ncbi:zinc finger protein Dzip1 isoform X2 [Cheilinus undulatus]|uniref:zinc finger protein Dzip1 isoform X2 n=1 Tax=Cheilinus undulatus TaxID=241271 RepID=UPI001BD5E4EF|nr:zinc finger protein Dzip1 isoform X2 [Cheilinus undulatus]